MSGSFPKDGGRHIFLICRFKSFSSTYKSTFPTQAKVREELKNKIKIREIFHCRGNKKFTFIKVMFKFHFRPF